MIIHNIYILRIFELGGGWGRRQSFILSVIGEVIYYRCKYTNSRYKNRLLLAKSIWSRSKSSSRGIRQGSSIGDSSKLEFWSRVQIRTKLEPLQWVLPNPKTEQHQSRGFFGRFHIFANSDLWLRISIRVVIVLQYDIYIKVAVF